MRKIYILKVISMLQFFRRIGLFFLSFSPPLFVFCIWPKLQQKFWGKACTHWTWVFHSGGMMVIVWIIPQAKSWASQRKGIDIVINIRAGTCFRKIMAYGGILEKSCAFFWNTVYLHSYIYVILICIIFSYNPCFFL